MQKGAAGDFQEEPTPVPFRSMAFRVKAVFGWLVPFEVSRLFTFLPPVSLVYSRLYWVQVHRYHTNSPISITTMASSTDLTSGLACRFWRDSEEWRVWQAHTRRDTTK